MFAKTLLTATFRGWRVPGITSLRCECMSGLFQRQLIFHCSSHFCLPDFLLSAAILSTDEGSVCFLLFSLLPLSQLFHQGWGHAASENTLPFPCQLQKKGVRGQVPASPEPVHSQGWLNSHTSPHLERCHHRDWGTLRPTRFSWAQKAARICLMGGSRFPKGGRGALIFEADTSEYISVYTFRVMFFTKTLHSGEEKKEL